MRVRVPLAVAIITSLAACNDLRDFRGGWHGARVGESAALRVGVADGAEADLSIDSIDKYGLRGTLSVDGLVDGAEVVSLAGAEADALSGMTFPGEPLRVYLAFVATADDGGDALALIALYEGDRVELRLLRGGSAPLYGIFALAGA
jgi:hypothetical protein